MDNRILDNWQIPFGAWIDQAIDWIFVNMRDTLDALAFPFDFLIDSFVNDFLAKISWVWVVLAMALIASLARNIKVGAFVAVSLTICGLLGNSFWIETARTIGFIAVAVFFCVITGIPIGIASGRVDAIWKVIRPILDAMQVVHSFVYMLPFIFFFGIGEVSATMVTMVFAVPPLIRLTNLGIRQVPGDVVEASRAYGAPEWRVLLDVQIPLARRAIMTGINQTLLLAISMLGIAAIMGAGGLGRLLFRALSNQDPALAASGGLAFFLVAIVLDRMTQREDTDTGNLFHRIRSAWTHRVDVEALLPDLDETKQIVPDEPVDRYAQVSAKERSLMGLTLLGGAAVAISVFLPWTIDAGKISAYGRVADEDLAGQTFNGLSGQGGSWFGFLVLAFGAFVVLAVIGSYLRPGTGPRWLAADGAAIAAIAGLVTAAAHFLAQPYSLANDPGTGIGVLVALIGGLIASVGAVMWLRTAPHSPLIPLSADIAWGRVIGSSIAVMILVIGMLSGWSYDKREGRVFDPEIQAQIEELRQEAIDNPAEAGTIAARLQTVIASAAQTKELITTGAEPDGSRLGVWALVSGAIAALAALAAAGIPKREEQYQWLWGTVAAGFGAGTFSIGMAWVFTHVRSADPNYLSGIGSFLTMLGGAFLVASTSGILKLFRRSRVYEHAETELKMDAEELIPVGS